MPYVSGLITFLRDYFRKIFDRRANAEMMRSKGMEVVDNVGTETLDNAHKMIESKWKFQPVKVIRRDSIIQSVSFGMHKKTILNDTENGLQNFQHQVEFYPTEQDWHKRIKCECGYFQVFGKPCFHAAFLLESIYTSKKTISLKAIHEIIGKRNTRLINHLLQVNS